MKPIEIIQEGYRLATELIRVKSVDYAGKEDFFKNFRSASVAGVSVERAILVRILDKLSRVSNLIDKEAMVKDEAIEDTLLDLINYAAILRAYLITKKPHVKTSSYQPGSFQLPYPGESQPNQLPPF